ncbi:hypothetical protein BH09BAC4_BH09BAC4_12740 [soil metagenome]
MKKGQCLVGPLFLKTLVFLRFILTIEYYFRDYVNLLQDTGNLILFIV